MDDLFTWWWDEKDTFIYLAKGLLVILVALTVAFTSPVWIIPYLIFKKVTELIELEGNK